MRRRRAAGVGVLVLGLFTGGCGYTVGGNLPPHVKTVAVPIFKNLTQQPAIENVITAAVVNAFANGGRLKVVPVAQADSILEGEIVGYTVDSIAFNSSINAQEFRLRVRLNIEFRVGGQVSQTISSEREGAASQAAVDIGRKIVSLALDRF